MSVTKMREKRQITLPVEVCEAACIQPKDQVKWSFEAGEIRGRKVREEKVKVLGLKDLDPKTLLPKKGKINRDSLQAALAAFREGL